MFKKVLSNLKNQILKKLELLIETALKSDNRNIDKKVYLLCKILYMYVQRITTYMYDISILYMKGLRNTYLLWEGSVFN